MAETAYRWVFGYGSLLWRPGFSFARSEQALLSVLKSGKWGRGSGGQVKAFEAQYAATTGTQHCLATANGSSALLTALAARHPKVDIPASNLKVEVARILKEEGYINTYRVADEDGKRVIKLYLKYQADSSPVISRIERVSKPGRRVYAGSKEIPSIIGGMGINVLTTPKGVMTGKKARKEGVGGEILCNVW